MVQRSHEIFTRVHTHNTTTAYAVAADIECPYCDTCNLNYPLITGNYTDTQLENEFYYYKLKTFHCNYCSTYSEIYYKLAKIALFDYTLFYKWGDFKDNEQ